MNISQTEKKVVLAPLRDVPKEVLFKTDTATRDQLIPNRYHFRFPSQWANQLDKEAIIGIRNMYVSRTIRNIEFTVECVFWDEKPLQYLGHFAIKFHTYLDSDDKIYKICNYWDKLWMKRIVDTYLSAPGEQLGFTLPELVLNDSDEVIDSKYFTIRCTYEYTGNECLLKFHRSSLQDEDYYTWNDSNGQAHKSKFGFSFTPNNSDTESLFGSSEHWQDYFTQNQYVNNIIIPCWSRYNLYLTSSISNEAEDNFLGHTDRTYNPIKYYRLTSSNKTFWVELYETRNHHCPVVLPEDNKDVLYIEAIVCFTSQSML